MQSNLLNRRIEWGDCDPAGIVFNPQYFRWFDHGTTMLYEAAGWPKEKMVEAFQIAGCPVVENGARYLRPCRYGDDVQIESAFVELGRSSFQIRHRLTLGGELCVEGSEKRVWTVHTDNGLRSAPLPDEIVAGFSAT